MRKTIQTLSDLACERDRVKTSVSGVKYSEKIIKNIEITEVEVLTKKAEKEVKIPIGLYTSYTVKSSQIYDKSTRNLLINSLKSKINLYIKNAKSVLIVGLGNREIACDSIGPLTCERVFESRSIMLQNPPLLEKLGIKSTSVLSPGVTAKTGIDTCDFVMAVKETVSADAVILIDSLKARDVNRLFCTVQISDCGLVPGSGIRTKGKAINERFLGAKVISVGVPTAVSLYSIVGKDAVFDSHDANDLLITFCDSMQRSEILAKIISEALNSELKTKI